MSDATTTGRGSCGKGLPIGFSTQMRQAPMRRARLSSSRLIGNYAAALGLGEKGRYITALTFGNVHGVYKPGAVKLRPGVLKEIQDAVAAKYGKDRPFDLVFHGGSGSSPEEIAEAVSYGVIKMNVDTDTQYAFTRPVAGWMMSNYDGVLKIDGEVGNKKKYDPRAWGKEAENAMSARIVEACEDLGSVGTHA